MTIFANITSTEMVAWWGAILASSVLLWDVYKWKSQGPKLVMRISSNVQVYGDPLREGKIWVSVTVSNVGDRPTTISSVGIEYYTGWIKRLQNRAEKGYVFPHTNDSVPLPKVLNPGEEWTGLIPQLTHKECDVETLSQTGHLMIWLSRSDKQRVLQKRLTIVAKK